MQASCLFECIVSRVGHITIKRFESSFQEKDRKKTPPLRLVLAERRFLHGNGVRLLCLQGELVFIFECELFSASSLRSVGAISESSCLLYSSNGRRFVFSECSTLIACISSIVSVMLFMLKILLTSCLGKICQFVAGLMKY